MSADRTPCPVCGAENSADLAACYVCGADLSQPGRRRKRVVRSGFSPPQKSRLSDFDASPGQEDALRRWEDA